MGQRATFRGSSRFVVRERLGAGAMGVVYAAFDRERQAPVAIKLLKKASPSALLRFKREFRALADVTHPNLCALHELHAEDGDWFFTMELVGGVDFYRHVRSADEPLLAGGDPDSVEATYERAPDTVLDRAQTLETVDLPVRPSRAGRASSERRLAAPLGDDQIERLEKALEQLVEGVQAIHDAGRLHRDLKPSNVLVQPDGRLVVLDFGVTTELGVDADSATHIVGTPAYMAPEQAAARPMTAAADWYAVGTMLYQVLTGDLPFLGGAQAILAAKQVTMPPRPSELIPEIPDRLDSLCMDLLRTDPIERPDASEILERLTSSSRRSAPSLRMPPSAGELIGREGPLLILRDTFATVARGEQRTVFVSGDTGVGKSALVGRFLDELRTRRAALVLAGRCYERESVQYKAVDGLIDELAAHLIELPEDEVEQILPSDPGALATMFPVLRQVPAMDRPPIGRVDAHARRMAAFRALRTLLARLARRRPVVLAIDDVHWGDVDSAALLINLLRPPEAPHVMFIASYRERDAGTSDFLSAISKVARPHVALSIEPLSERQAVDLAVRLIGEDHPAALKLAAAVARESDGNPFFVHELVRTLLDAEASGDSISLGGEIRLDDVVARRLSWMSEGARRMMCAVAIAGRPIAQSIAANASEIGADEQAAIAALRNANLVRTRGSGREDEIECFHDRIREAVHRMLGRIEVAEQHRRVAEAMVDHGGAAPEVLWFHFAHAGDTQRAGEYAVLAAEEASATLAFDRAAAFYQSALEMLGEVDAARAGELRGRLAGALVHAGRAGQAAETYLSAATFADSEKALDYRRLAAESFLLSGRIDEGVSTLRGVLEEVGLSMPATPRQAVWQVLRNRLRIKLRGLGFKARPREEVPRRLLRQVAVCWTASLGFSYTDHMKGAAFQSKHLLLALRAGEPHEVARALALEANYSTAQGVKGQARAEAITEMAEKLAREVGDDYLSSYAIAARGLMAYQLGQWQRTYDRCARAEEVIAGQANVRWELMIARLHQLWSLYYLGRLAELSDRVPELLHDADSRGDLHSTTCLSTGLLNVAWLTSDDLDGARRVAREAYARWTRDGFHMQHYWYLLARQQYELYAGDGDAAWRGIDEFWRPLSRSYLLRVPIIAFTSYHLRGRSALAAARTRTGDRRAAMLRRADRDSRLLSELPMEPAKALANLQCAGYYALQERWDQAVHYLAIAEQRLAELDMPMHAAAAACRRGEIIGGDEGAALINGARDWFAGQGVVAPARMVDMIAPGF